MAALKTVKEGKFFKVLQDVATKTKVIYLEQVRGSYMHVAYPGEDENEDGTKSLSYRMTAMLPKATHEEAYKAIRELIKELQESNDVKIPSTEWFLTDGDGEKYDDDKYKSYKGHWLVGVKDSKIRPRARDQRGNVMDDLDAIQDKFYSGCWVNLLIRPWYFNGTAKGKTKKYPKRILSGITSLQFFKDDEAFGAGRIDDTDVFGDVSAAGGGGGGSGMDDDEPL